MKKDDKAKKKDKKTETAKAGGCTAPQMPAEFYEQYPGAYWDSDQCFWRDSGGNPINPG